MKFAFLIMGDFQPRRDRASIHNGSAQIIGVSDIEEACKEARKLSQEGIDCLELCGAFGESGAKRVIEATEQKIAVGYIVHLPEQDKLYQKLFGESGSRNL